MLIVYFLLLTSCQGIFHSQHCFESKRPTWMCNYLKDHHRKFASEDDFKKIEHNLIRSHAIVSNHSLKKVQFDLSEQRFIPNNHLRNHRLRRSRPLTGHHQLLSLRRSRGSFDWRRYHGAVTPVKDQGQCGSCYTFAASAVLEFWSNLHRRDKHSLSTQIVLDCTSKPLGANFGCEGGWVEEIFEYAETRAVGAWLSYPYKAVADTCPTHLVPSRVQVLAHRSLSTYDDEYAERRLAYIVRRFGPTAVGIDVGTTELLFYYNGGIFPGDACGTNIDHAVTVVGYTPRYWIIKNSWGTKWGVKGYLYLERGVNACGVANYVNFVTKAKPLKNIPKTCI